jgi:V8-like Glu-specific endopeptidase
MFYDIDTSAGQSGAPVYALEDNQRVVGIHKAYWP